MGFGTRSANPLFFRLDRSREAARLFHDRIAALKRHNRHAGAVDVHDMDDYQSCDLYLSENGRAGFAVKDGDELVSVFSYEGEHAGDALVEKAKANGATHLDCYHIGERGLPFFYGRHGFTPVARVAWDDRFAPDGWDYALNGRPDVVAMALCGERDDVPVTDYDTAVSMAARAGRMN